MNIIADTRRNERRHDLEKDHCLGSEEFVQIETKFIAPLSQVADLLNIVQKHLKPTYLMPDTNFNIIESTYFDSERFDVFVQHFRFHEGRVKLRVRRYAPNGIPDHEPAMVELKSKINGVGEKSRFRIGNSDLIGLCSGDTLHMTDEFLAINANIEPSNLRKRVLRVNSITRDLGFKPRCQITYRRRAFEGSDLRVTFDDQISFRMLHRPLPNEIQSIKTSDVWQAASEMKSRFTQDRHLIVEVKHLKPIPEWMLRPLETLSSPGKDFSKYCFAIADSLSD